MIKSLQRMGIPRLLVLWMLQMLLLSTAYAQQKVTGKVTDEEGLGLPGVSVIIRGTTQGAVSDISGSFSINVEGSQVLVFSFVGYETQELNVSNRSVIDVALEPDLQQLEEIVVIGYGTQKKKDVTGSMTSIKSKDFNPGAPLAPEQLIQGKVAGVNIVQQSGAPGAASSVRIRGASSISGSNEPLYVVDGVPLQFGSANLQVGSSVGGSSALSSDIANPLNVINPADIESIDILKDASATAIYGSRGANGVIVITTKSNKGVGESISYNTSFAVGKIRKTLPVLSADQFRQFANENALEYPDEGANTDWQDEIFQTAYSQNHNIAFGASNGTSGFRASFGYNSQDGIIISSNMKKYTGRLNATHSALDGKLRAGINLTMARTDEDKTPISSNINNEGGNILKDALRWAPTLPVRNSDGSFYQIGELRVNPVSWGEEVEDERETNLNLANIDLAYDLMEGLAFKVNLGYSNENANRFTNVPSYNPAGETENGRASINKFHNTTSLIETTLNYSKAFGGNNLSLLAGYSYQKFQSDYTYTLANQFVSSAVKWNLIQAGNILQHTSNMSVNKLQSFFGRANLNITDKYLVTLTVRADGSSRFGPNNKYGVFPSGAVAWKLSEEGFIPTIFSDLKLRAGYGITGNQNIVNNVYLETLGIVGSNTYSLGGISTPAVLPTRFANPNIQWEPTSQLNIGLDYSIIRGRVSGTIDYYKKNTSSLLLEFSTAAPSVVDTQWANVGEVENSGIELSLNIEMMDRDSKFQWNTSLNFSKNNNEVISLSNDEFSREFIARSPLSGVVSNGANTQRVQPGNSLFTFWGRQFTGHDADGLETYLDEDGEDGADLVAIGDALPDFTYGVTNSFSFGRLDASFTLRGSVGNDVFNNTAAEFSYQGSAPGVNILETALNSEASRAQIPEFSSQWIEDASFLRLDNLSIGYTFETDKVSFLSNARLYVTAQNLFVITGYSGFDPEVQTNTNQGGTIPIGIDYLAYPRPRVFLIGASLSF